MSHATPNAAKQPDATRGAFTIRNVKIFDGRAMLNADRVTCSDGVITAVDGPDVAEAQVVDGKGGTLLPGLIDAHVHPNEQGLQQAVAFGVTTVIEMGGPPRTTADWARIAADDSKSDVFSAGVPLTAVCGHPNQLLVSAEQLFHSDGTARPEGQRIPGLADTADPAGFVVRRIREGSDFIKLLSEEGTVLAAPGLPELAEGVFAAAVEEAHRHDMLVVAHALTYEKTLEMLRVGAQGLTHIFVDRPHTDAIVDEMVRAGVFVIPCLVLNRSITGTAANDLASDPRVASRLSDVWLAALNRPFGTWPSGDFESSVGAVAALHRAGVPILAGTDTAVAEAAHGGLAMGASLHHELQMLVRAGLSPVEALSAATSVPAACFGLRDRGLVRPGYRADLLLVDGDPATDIAATLSISAVWRRGVKLTLTAC